MYNQINIYNFLINFLYFYANFDIKKNSLEIGHNGKCEIKNKGNDDKQVSVKSAIENKDVGEKCFRYNQIKTFFSDMYNFIKSEIYFGSFSVLTKLNFLSKHIHH